MMNSMENRKVFRSLLITATLTVLLLATVFLFRWLYGYRYALQDFAWRSWEDFHYFAPRELSGNAPLYIVLTLVLAAALGGLLSWATRRAGRLQARSSLLKQAFRHYRALSETDTLTGLATRRGVMERLEEEIKRASRYGNLLSTLFVDVDNFKTINDTLGHGMGDEVLKTIAEAIKSTVRETDVAGRYGGDEFLILLPHANAAQGCQVAERVRRRVENLFAKRSDLKNKPTVSLGVMAYAAGVGGLAAYLEAADQALLQSKSLGKNRTILCEKPGTFRPV